MKKLLAVILLQVAVSAQAQTEPEYRLELGGGVGMVTYLGDFNSNIFKNAQPMFTAMAKYRFTPRKALALNVSYGTLKGARKDDKSYYAGLDGYTFKHNVLDIGLRGELNFWPYGTGEDYRGAKRLTPYIYIGLGMTICKADKTTTGVNLPLGAGVKYKVASRVNMALEWTMHFTSSDNLDGIADPYGIKSSGLFKNTDCYSHLRLSLSYDLWAKCRTCHNDRD